MQRLLIVISIAIVAIFVSVNLSVAAGDVTNSDIATGAVDSRTIRDGGILTRDLRAGSVNTTILRDRGIAGVDLASSAYAIVQGSTLRSGVTVRGVIGGDFDVVTGQNCTDLCDWAGYASLPFAAPVGLGDDDVLVDVTTWSTGDGQTAPGADDSESGSPAACTGTLDAPTAPAGKVCIYVAGGDNAAGLKGVSVRPGTGTSKYGFKLVWSSNTDEDTFIDAVWAYKAP